VSAMPFDTQQVIDRIAQEVPGFQQVQGAADFAAVSERSLKGFRPPSAFVILLREQADNAAPKAGRQRMNVTLGVVLAVRNYRDNQGGEAADALRPLLGATRQALIGWTPAEPGSRPLKLTQGDVNDFDDNTLLWSEVYTTQHFIGTN